MTPITPLSIAQAAEQRIKEQIGDLVFANALLMSEVQALRARIELFEAEDQERRRVALGNGST
mgnify:FL=1